MTDKVQKIRKEVEKLHGNPYYMMAVKDALAIIDSLQEEPVSEKKCMFTKDGYTDEDRKVLCKDCDKKCEYNKKEEPVSEEWIKELMTKLDSMSKEDFKKVFDKYAIDFNEDPVSEDLSAENFIKDYTKGCSNLIEYNCGEVLYQPWLTPEDAMKAVEIAKEEVIEKALDWAKCRLTDRGFKDFKRYMEE